MRPPEKTLKLYQSLKSDILNGRLEIGSQLPSEDVFAQQLGVGRITLRNALVKLENDGLIDRLKRKGTFVRGDRSRSDGEKVISLLVPYPKYMTENQQSNIFRMFSLFFYGAVRGAAEKGFRLEPLVFSRTNSNQDIDFQALNHINCNSRILVYNYWYHTAFDFFRERNAKVGIYLDFALPSALDKYCSSWITARYNTISTYNESLKLLHDRNCRKILHITWRSDVKTPERTITEKSIIEEIAQKNDIEIINYCFDILPDMANAKVYIEKIRELYKTHKFDGIITIGLPQYLTLYGNLYDTLGIPHDVKILLFKDYSNYYLNTSPQISMFDIDMEHIGYELAGRLADADYKPCQILYKPELKDRESTGGKHILLPHEIWQNELAFATI